MFLSKWKKPLCAAAAVPVWPASAAQVRVLVALLGPSLGVAPFCAPAEKPSCIWPWGITYGSIFGWMNIHLPPILMVTRGTGF